MYTLNGKYGTATVTGSIDATTTSQIMAMINSPAFDGEVVMMEDAHAGAGCPIGTTFVINDRVSPSTVGVDIGCGVVVYQMLDSLCDLERTEINRLIRKYVPVGLGKVRSMPVYTFGELDRITKIDRYKYSLRLGVEQDGYQELCKRVGANENRALLSIGSLGSGKLIATG